MRKLKEYIQDESAINGSVEQMLLLGISVLAVAFVGYMIFSGINSAKKAMGADFIQGG